MPLRISIVGAGIAGLSTAVALRRANHEVTVFEKSSFASEIGAAVTVAPNGARVLQMLGFSFENARAVELALWETVDGVTLQQLALVDFDDSVERYGHPVQSLHRVDAHRELLRLLSDTSSASPVGLKLASPVVSVDAETGTLILADGTKHEADMIIGADGLHSKVREAVLEQVSALRSGSSAFRFLIPTDKLEADEALEDLLARKPPGSTLALDPKNIGGERHLVWYTCRGGEVQNLVGVHPSRLDVDDCKDLRDLLNEEFHHFHPDLLRLFSHAEDVKIWPLFHHEPFPRWHAGKAVIIGDAAHPMLPYGGQAANQALEDAGALGYLFEGVDNPLEIPDRLAKFELIRRKRASMIQILSSVVVGREAEVASKLAPFVEEGFLVPSNFKERTEHAISFDVFARCREVTQQGWSDGFATKSNPTVTTTVINT